MPDPVKYTRLPRTTLWLLRGDEFTMGGDGADEQPRFEAEPQAIYIGKAPITNLQYEAFDSGHQRPPSSVGDGDPVVLDASRGVLYLPSGGSVDLPDAESAVLQLSAADSDAAYIATPTALLRQPLGGGTPEVLATVDQGVPAAPVWLNGCAYAVWSGSGAYVRWCLGDTEAVLKDIDVSDSAELVLRTNRRVVVVNDVTAGTVWIVEDDVQKVDNWDDVTPPADDEAAEDESQDPRAILATNVSCKNAALVA